MPPHRPLTPLAAVRVGLQPLRVERHAACVEGLCVAGIPGCVEAGFQPRCSGQTLLVQCATYGATGQAIGANCQHPELGGQDGACVNGHCVQPDADAFCAPPLVVCGERLRCDNDAEACVPD